MLKSSEYALFLVSYQGQSHTRCECMIISTPSWMQNHFTENIYVRMSWKWGKLWYICSLPHKNIYQFPIFYVTFRVQRVTTDICVSLTLFLFLYPSLTAYTLVCNVFPDWFLRLEELLTLIMMLHSTAENLLIITTYDDIIGNTSCWPVTVFIRFSYDHTTELTLRLPS